MNTKKVVYEKLFKSNNVELEKHEIDLAKPITDIEKAYEKAMTLNKQFDAAKQQYDVVTNQLAKISEDFVSSYVIVTLDGKETLKAIKDLGITGPDVNWLEKAITGLSDLRNKIGNPTDWKPRK
jgi:hypothetical protein